MLFTSWLKKKCGNWWPDKNLKIEQEKKEFVQHCKENNLTAIIDF